MFISSTANLANNGTVTSNLINTDRIDYIVGYIKTDQAGTLKVQQTSDGGTNYDIEDSFSVVAGTTKTFSVALIAAQVRVTFTNTGGSTSTYLRLYAKGSSAGDS